MVSQTLASLLLHMPRRSVLHVHRVLLQMIRQDFTLSFKDTDIPRQQGAHEKGHVWEVRHAGLLGIKYEVAVRSDVVEDELVKMEVDEVEVAPGALVYSGREILQDVVDAAILG